MLRLVFAAIYIFSSLVIVKLLFEIVRTLLEGFVLAKYLPDERTSTADMNDPMSERHDLATTSEKRCAHGIHHAHPTRTPCARHAYAMRTPCAHNSRTHALHVPQVRPATRLPGSNVGGVGDARTLLAVLLPNLLHPRLFAVLGLLRL